MKILSRKKYNQLIQKLIDKDNTITKLIEEKAVLEGRPAEKKSSCKMNSGKDFCFNCANSYRYKTYWNCTEVERCGCLLDVSCENFERKD